MTIGKGHLAEAKAAINSPAAGARGAFSRKEEEHIQAHVGSSLRHDTSARLRTKKDANVRRAE